MTKQRFELTVNEHVAYADYHIDGGTLFIDYVFAPPELRGTGAAGKVMEGMMSLASEKNLQVTPICGYAASWIRRNVK